MTKVTSTIDLEGIVESITGSAEHGLRLAVEHLLSEANKTVPHDEGTLERSGRASVAGTRGAVSYDTPYAVRQHEDMTLHHGGKGEPKWLETTFARERDAVGKIVATATRQGMGG